MSKGSSRKRKQREMGSTLAEKVTAEDFWVVKKDILQNVQLFISRISTNKFLPRYPLWSSMRAKKRC